MTTTTTKTKKVTNELLEHSKRIVNRQEKVYPGLPLRFSEASTVKDRLWQGDVALTIANKIPEGFVKMKEPNPQLVHGNTMGSKHCLDSLQGVEMYVPSDYSSESLVGPYLILTEERVVQHPKHGSVTIPKGFHVQITYQKSLNRELKKIERQKD